VLFARSLVARCLLEKVERVERAKKTKRVERATSATRTKKVLSIERAENSEKTKIAKSAKSFIVLSRSQMDFHDRDGVRLIHKFNGENFGF